MRKAPWKDFTKCNVMDWGCCRRESQALRDDSFGFAGIL